MAVENKIVKAIEELMACCEKMKEADMCNSDSCPMHNLCLEDTSFIEVADLLHSEKVREFINAAENASPAYTKWDYDADMANLERNDPQDI